MTPGPDEWESRRARVDERRQRRATAARRRRLAAGTGAAVIAAVAIVLAIGLIDGEEERTFNATGFVEAANEHGAGLELTEELFTDQEDKEVYGLSFAAAEVEAGEVHEGSGGSLSVLADERSAESELARCRTALSLLCFRAANVVVALEGDPGSEGPQRLAAALTQIAGGGPTTTPAEDGG